MAKVQGAASPDTNNAGATTVTVTLAGALTGSNLGVGAVYWSNASGASLSTVSDGTNSYTIVQTTGADGNDVKCATFYKEGLTAVGGFPVITATFTGNATFRVIAFEEHSGVATTSALHKNISQLQASPGTVTDAVTSTAQTTTIDGCLIWGVAVTSFSATAPSIGTSFTTGESATYGAGDAFRMEYRTQTTQGSVAATFTTTAGTDTHHVHMLAFSTSVTVPPIKLVNQSFGRTYRPRPYAPGRGR